MHWRIKGAVAVCALLVAGLATGCSTESSAVSRPSASPSMSSAAPSANPRAAVEAAYRKWGLKPLAEAPEPPAVKPVTLKSGGEIPVISEIPTKEKIVFLTFDDGTEQDPQFITMMRELKLPITMFLTDAAIRSDYGYFTKLQSLGNTVENHTLSHPNLPTLGAAAQKQEICGQQTKLTDHYGTAPRLFRPPYGNWNEATRSAAASCGLQAIILWRESMQIKNMQYQLPGKKLRPGDIILAHFRGPSELKGRTITQMTVNMLRHIEEQGFTVARLEDYL
ncbi:polysaccharide deacetylase family protein [Streptomyces acidiscabies]|uniref:polysaccharide deacetylase family protein n=1 Tax=Streptomyces acidiscabies TaxID=42234 RepID=UPI0009522265|nr:polysaccharide deacetylase family protein [Streptomyces acidiscabies]